MVFYFVHVRRHLYLTPEGGQTPNFTEAVGFTSEKEADAFYMMHGTNSYDYCEMSELEWNLKKGVDKSKTYVSISAGIQ